MHNRLGGATVARLTPVQKVACSNHVRVTCGFSDSRFETCLGCSDDSNRGHTLITYAKKTTFLTLPPSEYACVHLMIDPPSLPIHAYKIIFFGKPIFLDIFLLQKLVTVEASESNYARYLKRREPLARMLRQDVRLANDFP